MRGAGGHVPSLGIREHFLEEVMAGMIFKDELGLKVWWCREAEQCVPRPA